MGEHVIKLPDVGEGVAEAELVEWHVKVGDLVREDTVLAAVMTDKATVEIPSPVDGEVLWLGAEIGDTVAVGSPLVRLKVAGEGNVAAGEAGQPKPAEAPAKRRRRPSRGRRAEAPASPRPKADAEAAPRRAESRAPRGLQRRRAARRGREAARLAGRAAARAGRPASTCARSPARGPAGRITHEDLDAFLARGPQAARRSRARARTTRSRRSRSSGCAARSPRRWRWPSRASRTSPMSRRSTSPRWRTCAPRSTRRSAPDRPKLTLLPFLMRAMVKAIAEQPELNALFDDEAGIIHQHGGVHIGIATQTPAGLVVPVVRHAEARDLWDCAAEVNRLAEAAQSRHRDARGAVRLDHHHHLARRHGRRRHDAGHQPSGSGDRRRQQDDGAAGLGRQRSSSRAR